MTGEQIDVGIAEFSEQWEGRTVDGKFPLEKFFGGSVFLTVYESRRAAIKLSLDNPEKRLEQWRAASKLLHPNLIRILATGTCEVDDHLVAYVVTEYAEENLSQVLPDRPLTAVETREALEPTLSALDAIHNQGFVHAHLKPSNIMAVDDRLKLSSDGLCRNGVDDVSPASPYDPPERIKGIVSAASDLWSLGITLCEILTQRRPENGQPPPGLPEPFAAIARGCLLRDPSVRMPIAQISKLLAPTEPAVIPAASRRKRYAPMGALILLGLIVIVVGGVIFMHSETGGAQPAQTTPAPVATTPQPQTAQDVKPAPPPEPKAKKNAKQEAAAKAESPKQEAPKREAKAEPPPAESTPPDAAPASPAASATPATGILSQPAPDITDQARNTIHGRVRLNVRVDVAPNGSVTNAKIESGSSKYFGERALAAVREWKFEPASVNGSEVAQRWRVRFEFQKSGTKVQPQRVSP